MHVTGAIEAPPPYAHDIGSDMRPERDDFAGQIYPRDRLRAVRSGIGTGVRFDHHPARHLLKGVGNCLPRISPATIAVQIAAIRRDEEYFLSCSQSHIAVSIGHGHERIGIEAGRRKGNRL